MVLFIVSFVELLSTFSQHGITKFESPLKGETGRRVEIPERSCCPSWAVLVGRRSISRLLERLLGIPFPPLQSQGTAFSRGKYDPSPKYSDHSLLFELSLVGHDIVV